MRNRLAVALALALAAGCSGSGGTKSRDADAGPDLPSSETLIETAPPPPKDDADADGGDGPDADGGGDADAPLPVDGPDGDASDLRVDVSSDMLSGAGGAGGRDGGDAGGAGGGQIMSPDLCAMTQGTLTVPSSVSGAVSGASRNNLVSCGGLLPTPGAEAVYTLKVEETMLLELRADSDFTMAVTIRSGCKDGVTELACGQSTFFTPPPVPTQPSFDGGFDGAAGSFGGSSDASADAPASDASGPTRDPNLPLTALVRLRVTPGTYTVLVDQLFSFEPAAHYTLTAQKLTPAPNASCAHPTLLSGATTLFGEQLDLASLPATGCGTSPGAALFYAVGVPSGQRLTARATPQFGDRAWMPRVQAFSTCDAASCLAQGHTSSGTTQQLDWTNNGASWRLVVLAVSSDAAVAAARFDLSVGVADQLASCGRPTPVVDGTTILNQTISQAPAPDQQTCTGANDHALYYAAKLLPQQTITVTGVGSTSQSPFSSPALLAIRGSCNVVQDCQNANQTTSFTNTSDQTKIILIEATALGFSFEPSFDLHVTMPLPPATINVIASDTLVTSEAGTTATFTVRLGSPPSATVTIPLSSNKPTEGTVSPAQLVFTTTNWDQAQTVTVTGVDDHVSDGVQGYEIVTGAASSTDTRYAALDGPDVAATNLDDDPGVEILGTPTLVTSEWGGKATFQIRLNHQPAADVHVPLASTNLAEGTVSPSELVFTSTDWNTTKTVIVTGVDDAIVDGVQAYTIAIGPCTSTDPVYAGIDPSDLVAHNRDDDFKVVSPRLLSGSHVCSMSNRQQVATDDFGTIYVAVMCDDGLLTFASTDGGATFTEPVTLPNTTTVGDVRIAGGPGGVAYLFFAGQTDGAKFTFTKDGGATWSAPITMQAASPNGESIGSVRVSSTGNTVILGLSGFGGGNTSFVWHSVNGGRAFAPRTKIDGFNLDLYARPDGKTVWLVVDGQLRKSTDTGATFPGSFFPNADLSIAEFSDTNVFSLQFNQLTVSALGQFDSNDGGTSTGTGGFGGGFDAGAGSQNLFFVNLVQPLDLKPDGLGGVVVLGDIDSGSLRVSHWTAGGTALSTPKAIGPHADNGGLILLSPKIAATAFAQGNLILFSSTTTP